MLVFFCYISHAPAVFDLLAEFAEVFFLILFKITAVPRGKAGQQLRPADAPPFFFSRDVYVHGCTERGIRHIEIDPFDKAAFFG
jgi:hypothetical protein